MKSTKLPFLEKVGYGAGDAAVNVVWAVMLFFVTKFYTDFVKIEPKHLIGVFLVVRLIDAVTDPLMGIVTDKVRTRFGRYRPYFLYLALPYAASVFLTFTMPDASYLGKLLWAYASYTLVTIVFTGVTIPYISVLGVMTEDPQDRLSANGYRMFFAKVTGLVVGFAVPIMAERWPKIAASMGAGESLQGYQASMGLMGFVAAALFVFCFFTVKERIDHQPETKPVTQQIKLLARNDQWLILAAVCIVGAIGYTVRGSVMVYYAQYFLGAGREGTALLQSTIVLVGGMAAIVAMVISTWVTKRFCKLKFFRWTQFAALPVAAVLYFAVGTGDVVLGMTLFFVLGLVIDLHAPVFWSAIPEAIDYGEKKTGERVSGLAYGGVTFWQKAGMAIGGAIVAGLLWAFGYKPDVPQSPAALTGIALMLSVIPAVFHVLVGLLMCRYKITDGYYVEMMKTGTLPSSASSDPRPV